ncbi:peptidoglycan hydrolase RipC [Mycolicibacterium frederiksbergense]|uniref:NlpC/P60 family protein n=1 Tax=Mycolicibacterium frederiksbergense TaxID=117567 RepID=A0A6H0RX70_9MYCO|nr:peptidoglycan hydrolase RipC [Mycolicibacterium frederiksbergense]QIV79718.1 NlpC/P60 family protein [Mycolicibacterium frederiksbergense]
MTRARSSSALRIVASAILLFALVSGNGNADPAADALARLNELSRAAEQTTEAMNSAQLDLDEKLAYQRATDLRESAGQAALNKVRIDLDSYQSAVDEVAAAMYMGGGLDGVSAALTANSPQQLIDDLSVQRVISSEMASRMKGYRQARERADAAARASADSATAARAAAEQAALVRAELQARQSELMRQVEAVKAQYAVLTPEQRAVLADPGPPPPAPDPALPTDPNIIAAPAPGLVESAPAPAGAPGEQNDGVVQAALTQLGKPYSWGATGPNAFDCSGLIQWAFLQTGRKLPRSSQALAEGGTPIAQTDLQPGDIVTFYSDVSHAGIYIGDGMMVHASTFGTPVKVAPISSSPFHNARRY